MYVVSEMLHTFTQLMEKIANRCRLKLELVGLSHWEAQEIDLGSAVVQERRGKIEGAKEGIERMEDLMTHQTFPRFSTSQNFPEQFLNETVETENISLLMPYH